MSQIYLIGGMPRVGKSTLAQMILERNKVSWMPLDTVREALTIVAPELEIQKGEEWWEGHQDKFFPFLRELIDSIKIAKMPYTLEGDSFLPEHAQKLTEEFGVKACFLGTSKLDTEILKTHKGVGDFWLEKMSEEKLNSLPDWIMKKSEEYRQYCEKFGIKYFDVSSGHSKILEEAYKYLLG